MCCVRSIKANVVADIEDLHDKLTRYQSYRSAYPNTDNDTAMVEVYGLKTILELNF